MPYSPLAVANEFIKLARCEGKGLEHMKIQKLVHFALGYALVDGVELVNENPQVWQYGPVFPSLYQDLKYHGSDIIREMEAENLFGPTPQIDDEDHSAKKLVEKVWHKYRDYTGFQLSDLTHKTGTPWNHMVREYKGQIPYGLEIPTDLIRKHYQGLPPLD